MAAAAMATTYKGSCLCGKINLQLEGKPSINVLCHCQSCKRATGGVFQANVFYAKEVGHQKMLAAKPLALPPC
jgi:hypothetical protein